MVLTKCMISNEKKIHNVLIHNLFTQKLFASKYFHTDRSHSTQELQTLSILDSSNMNKIKDFAKPYLDLILRKTDRKSVV